MVIFSSQLQIQTYLHLCLQQASPGCKSILTEIIRASTMLFHLFFMVTKLELHCQITLSFKQHLYQVCYLLDPRVPIISSIFFHFSISLIPSLPVSTISEITKSHSNSPATSSLFFFWQLLHKHLCLNQVIFTFLSTSYFFSDFLLFQVAFSFVVFLFSFSPFHLKSIWATIHGHFWQSTQGSKSVQSDTCISHGLSHPEGTQESRCLS